MTRQTKSRHDADAHRTELMVGKKTCVVDGADMPASGRRFRDAWCLDENDAIEVDFDRAKEIAAAELFRAAKRERYILELEEVHAQARGKKLSEQKAKRLEAVKKPIDVGPVNSAKTLEELAAIELADVLAKP